MAVQACEGPVAIGLDGGWGDLQVGGDAVVGPASEQAFADITLAPGQAQGLGLESLGRVHQLKVPAHAGQQRRRHAEELFRGDERLMHRSGNRGGPSRKRHVGSQIPPHP